MAESKRPSEAMLAAFAAVRTLRGKEPFPSWPYKIRLSKAELLNDPELAWNAFTSIVGESSYEELSEAQRIPHLAYWYEAELYNGGHLQYFRNSTGRYVPETIAALPLLRADAQAHVLSEAFDRTRVRPELIDPNRRYGELARTQPFSDLDRAYWDCRPELDHLLHQYLDEHLGDFILFAAEM